jgi:hypothetical protein
MQLGKIVSILCLTYIIYGVTSFFQLGTFLPNTIKAIQLFIICRSGYILWSAC